MLVGLILGALFVTPLVVTYALFIKWCDRFEPEPWWVIIGCFLFGAVFATLGGGFSSLIAEGVTTQLTGLSRSSATMQAFGATVFAPVFEEGFKGLGVLLIAVVSALGLKELDGPLDGAIYGGIIGLGFTLTEDILYVSSMFAKAGLGGFFALWFLRTVILGLSHCTFTAMTGLGFGIAAESRSWLVKILAPMGGLAMAMALHAFHNGLPSYFGGVGTVIMILGSLVIDVLFFVMVALLVMRDRSIVVRELANEVGPLLHARELQLVTSYVSLGWRNWGILFAKGWRPFQLRRQKQLALVELAFVKSRRRRGERGHDLDRREAQLRQQIAAANHVGVWLGS